MRQNNLAADACSNNVSTSQNKTKKQSKMTSIQTQLNIIDMNRER